ncbi:hypothetical protein HBI81_150480 [Parastagonospora nodorum]|nr:hypothetical protein HBH52_247580 [Parastagonospora nodorum]KAH4001068.1 hypothetical protein HBI10_098150 [Parastagonospora nodorum]KAH4032113.1 hypothetical protein HBI13_020290 [Parastagonospora nodorum]KAH4049781.1 hypothetical protein HBH49_137400 [Parastagonospora nodorum]KAH4108404.1 hypothetical protein HBH46_040750 [Parastagonospora nodorum]
MPRLVDLPLEILLEILSYNALTQSRLPTAPHPLNALALTNKHLHTVVEEYCRNRLKKYANFTPPRSRAFSCRRRWLGETCQFCKRKSMRRAILYGSLTCCRMCDKQYFPKMTMTQAHKAHSLSKLDLFTPNALHPELPPLTSGLYTVMGTPAIMLLEADVRAREAHIKARLGAKADKSMRRRPAAHDRIVNHMGLHYSPNRGWSRAPSMSSAALEKAAKSMQTEEGRREYVRKALAKEWEALGQGGGKGTQGEPLEIEDEDEDEEVEELMYAAAGWEYEM